MLKKAVFIIFAVHLLGAPLFAAQEEEEYATGPLDKARRAHEMAASDVIYEQQDMKALYFQNQRIIELLEEIKDEIHAVNARAAKEEKKA